VSEVAILVKSTLDKVMLDLVDTLRARGGDWRRIKGVEMDDVTQVDSILKAKNPVIVWSFESVQPSPHDPLYTATFLAGARTVSDVGNYKLSDLSAEIHNLFEKGKTIPLGDYRGHSAIEGRGSLYVTGISLDPQVFDHVAGIRFWSITSRVQRFI